MTTAVVVKLLVVMWWVVWPLAAGGSGQDREPNGGGERRQGESVGAPGRPPSVRRAPPKGFVETVLGMINPEKRDYGLAYEQLKVRVRQDILSDIRLSIIAVLVVVVGFLLLVIAVQYRERRTLLRLGGVFLADLVNDMELARAWAEESIQRYNQHMELCNLQVEKGQVPPKEVPSEEVAKLRRERAVQEVQLLEMKELLANPERLKKLIDNPQQLQALLGDDEVAAEKRHKGIALLDQKRPAAPVGIDREPVRGANEGNDTHGSPAAQASGVADKEEEIAKKDAVIAQLKAQVAAASEHMAKLHKEKEAVPTE